MRVSSFEISHSLYISRKKTATFIARICCGAAKIFIIEYMVFSIMWMRSV